MIELLKRILAYLTGLRQENERLKKELAKIKEWVDKIYEATKR